MQVTEKLQGENRFFEIADREQDPVDKVAGNAPFYHTLVLNGKSVHGHA